MRLGLAAAVAIVHSMELGFGHQPAIGNTMLGDLAVDAFFVLSGFLITASYLRLDSVARYSWHRFLRIMPGFWICLILTATLVAPVVAVMQDRSALSVFTTKRESALDYVLANGALLMTQYGVDGLPADVAQPGVLDGSLWTLFYEAVCYIGVIGLGVIGALRRRPVLTLVAAGAVWLLVAADAFGLELVAQERMPRFTLLFLIGAAVWLYAHRIPIHAALGVGSLAVLAVSLFAFDDYVALGGPALAYVCVWMAVTRPPTRPVRNDLSYGLYIYHWPVEQMLVVAGLAAWGRPAFAVVSLSAAMLVAAASWWWVERPALGWKNAAWVDRLDRLAPRRRRHEPAESLIAHPNPAPTPEAAAETQTAAKG